MMDLMNSCYKDALLQNLCRVKIYLAIVSLFFFLTVSEIWQKLNTSRNSYMVIMNAVQMLFKRDSKEIGVCGIS